MCVKNLHIFIQTTSLNSNLGNLHNLLPMFGHSRRVPFNTNVKRGLTLICEKVGANPEIDGKPRF